MSNTFRPWLPEAALLRRDLGKALSEAVADWSARWFVQARVVPLGAFAPGTPPAVSSERKWHVLNGDIAVLLTEGGERLALRALAAAEEAIATPADREVAMAMQQACTTDLHRRLAIGAGFGGQERWTPSNIAPPVADSWLCSFGVDAATPLFQVVIAAGLIIDFAKAGLPPVAPQPLGSLAEGLSAQPIRLGAKLGGCTLTLADFAALSEGDIIVLDRTADSAVPLAIDGLTTAVGTCSIGRSGDALDLTLLDQPLTQAIP